MSCRVLVCGQLPSTGELVNLELEFPSRPRPVALGRAAQAALADEELARSGRRTESKGYIMLYDESRRQWTPLTDERQLQQFDQVFFASDPSAGLPAAHELPEPRCPVTADARKEPVGGWPAAVPSRTCPTPPHPVSAPPTGATPCRGTPPHPSRGRTAPVSPAPSRDAAAPLQLTGDEGAVRVVILELQGLEAAALPPGRAAQAEVALEGYEPLVTVPSATAYWNEAFDFCPAPPGDDITLRITVHVLQLKGHVPPGADGCPPSGAPVGGVEVSVQRCTFAEQPRRMRLPLLRGTTGHEVATVAIELLHVGASAP
eukprot:TRINITY_DN61366_c0_g1_i1.p1 TRINITY_DN61366_c0_g1~~TRINITY_DN61366_c0_g1_i1.p1  ORF type:complete len:343 (+),score=70.44 TRINITY_DN61366_c0_g1_i1:82-1029(+)